jgi:hypothetical protein
MRTSTAASVGSRPANGGAGAEAESGVDDGGARAEAESGVEDGGGRAFFLGVVHPRRRRRPQRPELAGDLPAATIGDGSIGVFAGGRGVLGGGEWGGGVTDDGTAASAPAARLMGVGFRGS